MDFARSDYYSQTELCKLLKLSPKKLKTYIEQNNIPVLKRPVEIGLNTQIDNIEVTGLYVLKSDITTFIS